MIHGSGIFHFSPLISVPILIFHVVYSLSSSPSIVSLHLSVLWKEQEMGVLVINTSVNLRSVYFSLIGFSMRLWSISGQLGFHPSKQSKMYLIGIDERK